LIVRNVKDLYGTPRDVRSGAWRSLRLLLAADGAGFSFHITAVEAGAELPMQYTNHIESVYCISGEGSVEECATGRRHEVAPGVLYVLDRNDRHVLRARSPLVLACVFQPALHGPEIHDENGSYPESGVAS